MSVIRRFIEDVLPLPSWLRDNVGTRYVVGVLGLAGDISAELIALAMKSAWSSSSSLSEGAATLLSQERGIYRVAGETLGAFGARLTNAWETWAEAGKDTGLIQVLADHGWPNAQIYTDADWSKPPTPWWSQFWLFFEFGDHSVGVPHNWGDSGLVWGGGATWGSDLTTAEVNFFRKVVNQFRPAARICRGVIFETASTGPGSVYSPWNGAGVELAVTTGAPE